MNTHTHAWAPRSDLGRARYSCECGAHAFRRLDGSYFECNPPSPTLTVDWHPLNRHPDGKASVTLQGFYSDRHHPIGWKDKTSIDGAGCTPSHSYKVPPHRSHERDLVFAAWREMQVVAGYCGEILVYLGHLPPPWFIREELGYAIEHGPSLRWTCSQLATTNRRSVQQLGEAAPYKVTYPRDFKDPRKKRRDPRSPDRERQAAPRGRRGATGVKVA